MDDGIRRQTSRLEPRLDRAIASARLESAPLTLLLIQSWGDAPTCEWQDILTRQLLVGDDWSLPLPDGLFAYGLSHTGPNAGPAVHGVMTRLSRQYPIAYGLAHYPGDAKAAHRLIDVAAKRMQATQVRVA